MKWIKLENKAIEFSITDNLFGSFKTDWIQLYGKWNWYSFTFVNLEIENDKWTGGAEIHISLIGFHFFFRWNYNPEILEKLLADSDKELNETE